MRTAIYVYEPTTLHIETHEDGLKLVQLDSDNAYGLETSNSIAVEPGVYKILSTQAVDIITRTGQVFVQWTLGDKDQWPDPPPSALRAPISTTSTALHEFFAVTDGRSLASV
jgi:hypothetical protein